VNRMLRVAVALMSLVLAARDAAAQWNAARLGTGANRVYTTVGFDPAVVTSLGYVRVVRIFGHPIAMSGEAGIAAAELDTRDFRAQVGAFSSIVHWRSLHLTGRAAFITRGTENSIYQGLNFGSDFTGTAGMYRPGWFLAGEFGFDKAIITHITHSDWYRRYFYPDARDGWYLTGGGTFHYGGVAGVSIGHVELMGRAGWRRTENFNDVVPPMYVSLGAGVTF